MPSESSDDKQLEEAVTLDKAGQHDRAASIYRKILEQSPGHAFASHLLGVHAMRQGRHEEAVRLISAAISVVGDEPLFHYYLGHAQMALQHWPEAVDAYSTVIQLAPGHADAQLKLGVALKKSGQVAAAIDALRRAMQLDTGSPGAGMQLAQTLRAAGNLAEATRILQALLLRYPDVQELYSQTGSALLAADAYTEARQLYLRKFELQRGKGCQEEIFDADDDARDGELPQGDTRVSPFFLHNLIGHIHYLVRHGKLHASFLELADICREIIDAHQDLADDYDLINLQGKQAERILPYLFRALYRADSDPLESDAVNPALDFPDIENEYLESSGPMTVIDGFLTQEALGALRKFLYESTIFFRVSHNTFIASYVDEGFSCSVLYQIAAELKQRFPRVLGDKELRNMWVYRQPPRGEGVRAHSDQAAVTFNFWITPDESNLDRTRGGLIVYDRQQPLEWDWYRTNAEKDTPEMLERITDYLEGAGTSRISYRENRAVMFHSNLFHRSDSFHFREGYEHSRMNITLLFGDHPANRQLK